MLLVMEKIALPSPLGRDVYMGQLHDKETHSYKRAREGLDSIAEARHKLNRKERS